MKINLPKHEIASRSRHDLVKVGNLEYVGLKEIPLAFINAEEVDWNYTVTVKDEFLKSKRDFVRPYDTFNDTDQYFFDQDNNMIHTTLKRVGETYYYEPSSQTEYTPLSFQVNMDLQRQLEYRNNDKYDIKVSVIDDSTDLTFAKNLITIFGDKFINGDCPPNIRINGGSLTEMSLINQDYRTADFVFLQSDDGLHYGDLQGPDNEIDFEYILNNHTNIWLSVKEYDNKLITKSADGVLSWLHMTNPILYTITDYSLARSHMEIWDQDAEWLDTELGSVYLRNYLNEAILIQHKVGKGFLIITPDWFLNDLNETYKMVYEAMMYCYLRGYYSSTEATLWITDEPVDYLSYHTDKYNRKHNIVKINDLIGAEDWAASRIINVNVNSSDVSFLGINDRDELLFAKIAGTADPPKKTNEQSFYTTKHTIINYTQDDIYTVEMPLTVNISITDNTTAYVIVQPMISSSQCIYTTEIQTFKIDDLSQDYVLYVNSGSSDIENTFFLLKRSEKQEENTRQVATIKFEAKNKIKICDTRISGGGLPIDQPDDYDMLDIGHINGRPYRVGSSLIIKLPKKLKQFENRIRLELDKHIAAGDEYVLCFDS